MGAQADDARAGEGGCPGVDGVALPSPHTAHESGGGRDYSVGMGRHAPADIDTPDAGEEVATSLDSARGGGGAKTPADVHAAATCTTVRRREPAGDECSAPASSKRRRSSDPVDVAEFNHFYGLTARAKQEQTSPDLFNRRSSSAGSEIAQWDALFGGQVEVKVSYDL